MQPDCGRTGSPVSAVLVQANPGLFRAGMLDLPCLVVFSFEESDYEVLNRISERVAALKNSGTNGTGIRRYCRNCWRRPPSAIPPKNRCRFRLTGGLTVYAADLFVNRRYLEKGYLTRRTLPCFARTGRSGRTGNDALPDYGQAGRGGTRTFP